MKAFKATERTKREWEELELVQLKRGLALVINLAQAALAGAADSSKLAKLAGPRIVAGAIKARPLSSSRRAVA